MICNKRWVWAACLSPLSLINDERQRHSKRVTAINSSVSRPPLKLLSITSGNVAGYGPFISFDLFNLTEIKEEKKKRNYRPTQISTSAFVDVSGCPLKPRVKGETQGL